ncbi:hypothetical protein KVV02_002080 [Mortierella alpina]|uniref:Beta-lactamase/transpeptidase-like protein n=1 Tax=Mortierella alpina TaxID=64518 RepID=A0A9P8A0A7_MORAP|nr:hypothetical protein KVV02_002080 [Mortierella alpina]
MLHQLNRYLSSPAVRFSFVQQATLRLSGVRHASSTKKPLAGLYDTVEKARLECGIPGMSLAVLHKGELIFAEGFGKRNEQGNRYTVETLQPIASVTKAFTATAIGEMVAEGKLDWDTTPVNKYLPEFELQDPILTKQLTVIDLLSHRTDLGRKADMAFYKSTTPRIELIKRLKLVNVQSKLRSDMNYSNALYTVAGEAAARVAGMSYEDIVREKVLNPLGLKNTGFSVMEMKGRTTNYSMPFSAASFEDAQRGFLKQEMLDQVPMAYPAAGDVYSSVLDLVQWGRAVLRKGELDGKQVLNKSSVQETLTARTIMAEPREGTESPLVQAYGLGWILDSYKGRNICWHNGAWGGFSSCLVMFPDEDLVVAHLCNLMHSDLGTNIYRHIADDLLDLPKSKDWLLDVAPKEVKSVYEATTREMNGGGRVTERIPDRPSAHILQAFIGEYSHPLYGDACITLEKSKDGKETLLMGALGFQSTMEHHHFESFLVRLVDANVRMKTVARFQTATDGSIDSFVVDIGAPVEFKRKEIR